jgi:hypothetical protein
MCFWILTLTANVISRTSVQGLTQDKSKLETIITQIKNFDVAINAKIGDHIQSAQIEIKNDLSILYILDEDDDEQDEPFDESFITPDDDNISVDMYDNLLSAEALLPHGETVQTGQVIGYKRDHNGKLIGNTHQNPLLNTHLYQVQFNDGSIQDFAANCIAVAIYNEVDDEGNKFLLFKGILSHRKTAHAVTKENMWSIAANGSHHMKRTTAGWEVCVKWKNGSTSWESLANIKNSYPIQLADYAVLNKINDEPAFAWRIPQHLQNRTRILKATKRRCKRRNTKFGIVIPRMVAEALKIDKDTNTSYWANAIKKEMKNNRVAFQFLNDNEKLPIGYKYIRCHMNFEVKMDFHRKARFVAGGHMTEPLPFMTYSSIVLRDSIRIGFLLAGLNDLDLISINIGNAYLQASCTQ